MKSACLATIVFLAMSAVSFGQHSGKTSAATATVERALLTRFQQYAEALKRKDTAALDKIWADDYSFIDPRGVLLTKAERLENVRSGATSFDDIELHQEKVYVLGNTAIDIGRVSLRGTKYSGLESSGEYRYMNVWTSEKGEWRLLANQITFIKK
jgi:ketosteroid isomerase-like protein